MLLPEYLTNSNSQIVSGDENEDNDVGYYDDDYDDEMRNEDENGVDDDNVVEEDDGDNSFDFLQALCASSQKSLRVREKIARTDLVYCHSYSPGFHKF